MRPRSSLFLRAMSLTVSGMVLFVAAPAWAAGSNMPWEQPLNQILQSVEGPVAKIIAVIIIIVTGLTLAFGDSSGGLVGWASSARARETNNRIALPSLSPCAVAKASRSVECGGVSRIW